MKNLTKKRKVNSKATLDLIMASMPNVTAASFFDKFDVSLEMTSAFLAKSAFRMNSEAVTFLN